jgi:hypothetical protein
MWELELMEAAERIVREVVALRPEDKVLVVTDAAKLNIGKALGSVSRMLGTETVLALMPMTGEHGNEPPATKESFSSKRGSSCSRPLMLWRKP